MMNITGIVRRIDDLGRVAIPKDIRQTLRIREGDPLEIFTDTDGKIILQKYSIMGSIKPFSDGYTSVLSKETQNTIAITDLDFVIAVNGKYRSQLKNKCTASEFYRIINKREVSINNYNLIGGFPPMEYQLVVPIISEGDVVGSIIMFSDVEITENEMSMLQLASKFLASQIEN